MYFLTKLCKTIAISWWKKCNFIEPKFDFNSFIAPRLYMELTPKSKKVKRHGLVVLYHSYLTTMLLIFYSHLFTIHPTLLEIISDFRKLFTWRWGRRHEPVKQGIKKFVETRKKPRTDGSCVACNFCATIINISRSLFNLNKWSLKSSLVII